jgi:hypothetical protein
VRAPRLISVLGDDSGDVMAMRLVGGRRTADTSGDELAAMITGTLTA